LKLYFLITPTYTNQKNQQYSEGIKVSRSPTNKRG